MQYYLKIFNKKTNEFVGFYKETGVTNITKMPKGTKYFNTVEQALLKLVELDDGFLRDKDNHYYNCHVVVYGDSTREPTKDVYRNSQYKEEELKDELEAFIRENRSKKS